VEGSKQFLGVQLAKLAITIWPNELLQDEQLAKLVCLLSSKNG
jgi:hypothetical protein